MVEVIASEVHPRAADAWLERQRVSNGRGLAHSRFLKCFMGGSKVDVRDVLQLNNEHPFHFVSRIRTSCADGTALVDQLQGWVRIFPTNADSYENSTGEP